MGTPLIVFDYVLDCLLAEAEEIKNRKNHGYIGLAEAPSDLDVDFIMAEVRTQIQARKLIDIYGYWSEHPKYAFDRWHREVAATDTRQGYWQWVVQQMEEGADGDGKET